VSQPEWDALVVQIRDLQERVLRLEAELGLAPAAASTPARGPEPAPTPAASVESTVSLFPIFGRALLGLAGAYLLRMLTESATLARPVGVAAGLLYAMLWLVWAARTPAEKRLETALHGLTSALVLSPLLYEATARFHAISTWTAAFLLVAFTVFGFAVSWRKDLLVVATFATLAGLGTSGALLIATRDALPFTFVFLAIAAAVEVSACLNHWLSERWLTATAADLAVLLITWLVTNDRGLPDAYSPIPNAALLATQVALLAIYLSSTIVRTLLRGFTFTGFETAQCVLAFAISVGGGLRLTRNAPAAASAMAVLMLACAAACYLVAFKVLDRGEERGRNFYTYSTFGILLAIAGSRILLSGMTVSLVWSGLAIAAFWAGGIFGRLTLQVHGGIYLLFALAASGAIQQATALLLGSRGWTFGEQGATWTGAFAAAICYALGTESPRLIARTVRVLEAALLVWLSAAIAAGLLTFGYHVIFGAEATHDFCATLRTAVIASSAVLLARIGNFAPLSYGLMALGAWRLVAVDLQQEHKGALFLSLLLYGAALIVLPKIARSAPRTPPPGAASAAPTP
jgi:hypothetical protein